MSGRGTAWNVAKRVWKGLQAASQFVFKRNGVILLVFCLASIFIGAFGTVHWPPTPWIIGGIWALLFLPELVDGVQVLTEKPPPDLPADFWWPKTPLSRPDAEPAVLPEFTDLASLQALFPDWRPQHPHGRYVALFVPAYGKRMRFWVSDADLMAGFTRETLQTISDIVAWTADDRSAIRQMLAESSVRDGDGAAVFGAAEVEDVVAGAVIYIAEGEDTRSRFAMMELEAPWVPGHPLYIVIRDGRPIAASAYDASVWDYEDDEEPVAS